MTIGRELDTFSRKLKLNVGHTHTVLLSSTQPFPLHLFALKFIILQFTAETLTFFIV